MGGGASKAKKGKANDFTADMLLLGAPSVGKSTIFRQMKLLYRDGFTPAERSRAKIELRRNLILSVLRLDEVALDEGWNLGSNDAEEAVTGLKLILSDYEYDERDDQNAIEAHQEGGAAAGESVEEPVEFPAGDVKTVFADPAIQQAYKKVIHPDFVIPPGDTAGRELLQTALPYVLKNIDRITSPDFSPTDADCLHLRRHTTNVERISFECELSIRNKMEKVQCTCTDIGGQAQEQTKWEEHAEKMDFLVYVSSMADFDRVLPDGSNSLDQQFKLLSQVLKANCFKKANVIVLLNKSDVLKEKLQHVQLKTFFEDFEQDNTPENAQAYFQTKCENLIEELAIESGNKEGSKRQLQVVPTCALDSELMKNVLTKALAVSMCSTLLTFGLIA